MKAIVVAALLVASASAASAQGLYGNNSNSNGLYGTGSNSSSHYVAPHLNSNGTVTQGHQQTNPNNTQLDNYGTRGNYNPYTGTTGTRTPRY